MPKNHAPYLTREPWLPFTPREKQRGVVLKTCPSAKCRRAKACVDAHDNLYCQRSHESVAQFRARAGYAKAGLRQSPFSDGELEALREKAEERLADMALQKQKLINQWKAGAFNDTWGKYKPHGVWKHPPIRQYTDE